MKTSLKIIFTGFLLTNSVALKAEWVVLVGSGTQATFAVENKAFLRSGNQRQFWAISNLAVVPKQSELQRVKSAVVLHETDCSTQNLKVLYMRLHSERDGDGAIISETNIPFGADVNDAERTVIRYICSR